MTTEDRGGGQPEVGRRVRYRDAQRGEHEATITAVGDDGRTVDLRLDDGSVIEGVPKGGRPGGWRPPEDDGDDEEGDGT